MAYQYGLVVTTEDECVEEPESEWSEEPDEDDEGEEDDDDGAAPCAALLDDDCGTLLVPEPDPLSVLFPVLTVAVGMTPELIVVGVGPAVTVLDNPNVTVNEAPPSSMVEVALLTLDDSEVAAPLSGTFVGDEALELEVEDAPEPVLVALWSSLPSVASAELWLEECLVKLKLKLKTPPMLVPLPDEGEPVGVGLGVDEDDEEPSSGPRRKLVNVGVDEVEDRVGCGVKLKKSGCEV